MWYRMVLRGVVRGWFFRYVCLTMLAALLAFGVARAGGKMSRWVAHPVIIDGNNEEWPQPYAYSEDVESMVQYAIANDGQTLYLTIKTSEEATKRKMKKNGLTIFVDTTGKKLMAMSFTFSIDEHQLGGQHRGYDTTGPHDTVSAAITAAAAQKLNITGLKITGSAGYDTDCALNKNRAGIAAAASMNDFNELVWEIAIPFKCIYPVVGDHVSGEDRISLCFGLYGLDNNDIAELTRANEHADQAAMPVWSYDTTSHKQGDGGGTPVRGANGGMGVGIGGGRGKGGAGGDQAPVIDAAAASQNRELAGKDNQIWRVIKLSYEQ